MRAEEFLLLLLMLLLLLLLIPQTRVSLPLMLSVSLPLMRHALMSVCC